MAATASSAATSTTSTATAAAPGTAGVETYEDMFKEITRKLYGEETGHGLHSLGPPIAQLATTGPTLPEGERSFTTLISDRPTGTGEFELNSSGTANKDHLFGLAALMQNGFNQSSGFSPGPGKATASPEDVSRWNSVVGASDNCPELLHWNVNQPTPGKSSGSKGSKGDGSKRSSHTQPGNSNSGGQLKRYTCSTCPYTTDRRDLYTRHENIHKTEKPFHCYVCLKQFNRADHVKKHFLRMHRELQYDINKTRKTSSVFSVRQTTTSSSTPTTNNNTQVPANEGSPTTTAPPTQFYEHNQSQQQQQHQGSYNGPPVTQPTHQRNHSQAELIPTHVPVHQPLPTLPNTCVTVHQVNANGHVIPEQRQPQQLPVSQKIKQEKSMPIAAPQSSGSPPKKKGDKKFVCCYCPWTGADNWGLKRHLNTHTKPYVCMLCDYKAARSERLVTHVYKVHNKKACNKCSFLADDHVQYLTHQSEAHRSRQQCTNSNNQNPSSSVLRAIGNTTNTLASGSGQNMALFGNGFGQATHDPLWRPTPSASNIQKRGADRLFQYMEADHSDPEDYQKQLQMTALSRSARNTVAQDFHNAGGGGRVASSTKKEVGSTTTKGTRARANDIATSLFANKGYQQKFIRDLEEFVSQRLNIGFASSEQQPPVTGGVHEKDKSSSIINTPPPAKRRRCASHDKENYRHGKTVTKTQADRGQINAQMREIFQMITTHYGEQLKAVSSGGGSGGGGGVDKEDKAETLEQLERILKNNQELTVSIRDNQAGKSASATCVKYTNGDSGLDDEEEEEEEGVGGLLQNADSVKSKRKQFVPRKIGTKEPRNNYTIWSDIRDKHLSRLMSQKRACRVCVRTQNSMNITPPVQSHTHQMIRHWKQPVGCGCGQQFKKPYQLMLHRRRSKH